jgi:hypothetical protein
MPELQRDLRALAAAIDYPPTPDLAAQVGARLDTARRTPQRPPLRLAVAIAAVWLAATSATVLAASRQVADALLDASGLVGVKIERTSEPAPAPAPRDLDLGRRVRTLEAIPGLSFAPLKPRLAGSPAEVYARPQTPAGEISLVYEPRASLPPAITTGTGLLITEFRGDLLPEYLTKIAPEATSVERLRIDGDRAVWISGAPHYFLYRAPGGPIAERDLQVAQNVLLVERGPVLVRMEGTFGRATAIRLARSLHCLGTCGASGL